MRPWSSPYVVGLLVAGLLGQSPTSIACGTKRFCREMRSCAEASYYLERCGLHRLDGDRDGIPCETLCGKTLSTYQRRVSAQTAGRGLTMFDAGSGASQPAASVPATFTCGTKRTCREMDSCEEATFYLTQCGRKRLDGNKDGVACNSLCRR